MILLWAIDQHVILRQPNRRECFGLTCKICFLVDYFAIDIGLDERLNLNPIN